MRLKKKQTEILKVKHLIKDISNELLSIRSRTDQMEERIRDIKDRI